MSGYTKRTQPVPVFGGNQADEKNQAIFALREEMWRNLSDDLTVNLPTPKGKMVRLPNLQNLDNKIRGACYAEMSAFLGNQKGIKNLSADTRKGLLSAFEANDTIYKKPAQSSASFEKEEAICCKSRFMEAARKLDEFITKECSQSLGKKSEDIARLRAIMQEALKKEYVNTSQHSFIRKGLKIPDASKILCLLPKKMEGYPYITLGDMEHFLCNYDDKNTALLNEDKRGAILAALRECTVIYKKDSKDKFIEAAEELSRLISEERTRLGIKDGRCLDFYRQGRKY